MTATDDEEGGLRRAAVALLRRGFADLGAGRFDDADSAFSRAAAALPDSPVPVVLRATLCQARSDNEGALRVLRGALQAHGGCALLRVHLADAYARAGNSIRARAELAKASELDAIEEVRELSIYVGAWIDALDDAQQGR